MSKLATLMNRVLAAGAVAGLLASCTSSKIGMVHQTSTQPAVTATAPVAPDADVAPAAAQGAPAAEAYASTADEAAPVAAATPATTLEKAAREQATAAAPQAPAKKLSLAERAVAKALVKKIQKAEKKFDLKKEKARKAGKAEGQVRTGIIVAVIGLGLLLLGAILGINLLWGLGGVAIAVGLIIILLAALDVI